MYDNAVLRPQSPFCVHNLRHPFFRAERVHPLNVPFTHAVKTVTAGDQAPGSWSERSKELRSNGNPRKRTTAIRCDDAVSATTIKNSEASSGAPRIETACE